MTETGNSFHAASSLCLTSSTVTAGVGWRASFSGTHNQMFSMANRYEVVQARAAVEYPVYRRRSEHEVQHVVLHYLVGRLSFADP